MNTRKLSLRSKTSEVLILSIFLLGIGFAAQAKGPNRPGGSIPSPTIPEPIIIGPVIPAPTSEAKDSCVSPFMNYPVECEQQF